MITSDDDCFSLRKSERMSVKCFVFVCFNKFGEKIRRSYLLFNGRTRTATRTEAIINQKQPVSPGSVFSLKEKPDIHTNISATSFTPNYHTWGLSSFPPCATQTGHCGALGGVM